MTAPKYKTIMDRFESKIASKESCWIWKTPNKVTGYGEFTWKKIRYSAHRFSYEYFKKEQIPLGMQVDHICRNRACVNPDHLRLLTLQENVLCGTGITAINKIKTHCIHGHEFTEENTYMFNGSHRGCKICRHLHTTKSRNKLKKSNTPCVICGKDYEWKGCRPKTTCSQSCAVKLSHLSGKRKANMLMDSSSP